MGEIKTWYIDRSRNYYYKELPSGLKSIVELYKNSEDFIITPELIISKLVCCGVISNEAKNKFAHLTRFRDHGFINMYNQPGDSVIDFVENRLSLESMIIDHFIKRPVYKDRVCSVKPFILLCVFFANLFQTTNDINEHYISMLECKNHLYDCKKYSDINENFIKNIISERHSNSIVSKEMEENEITNFSIWFNALKNTSVFYPKSDRYTLIPNHYARSFFDYISNNSNLFEFTPICDEKGDSSLQYEYYCNRRKGINEIMPKHIKPNIKFDSIYDCQKTMRFLFGLSYDSKFKYDKYIKNSDNAFGIYNPFLSVPDLAVRHVWMQNNFLGDSLYDVLHHTKNMVV